MKTENRQLPDLRFLLYAGVFWIISAFAFLLAASFAANLFETGERGLAYLSSAVSFLAAFAAGMLSLHRTHAPGIPAALLTATVLVISLLTVGFLVQGDEMNPSAVLSIVSFTYAGVLSGMLFRSPKKAAGRKHSFSN